MIAESKGIAKLSDIRERFRESISGFEAKAKPCSACENPGICCRDAHFVNVRITKLEAAAIKQELNKLDVISRDKVEQRAEEAVEKFGLRTDDEESLKTYACPLFERDTGCLVHYTAKPLPCIAHACYENAADLPRDELLEEREREILRLNRRIYGRDTAVLPLPLMIARRLP